MKRHPAFTLIELLVVISIIALLIVILLPALAAARRSARDLKCKANMRSIGQAILVYAAEQRDYLPPANQQLGGGQETYWHYILMNTVGASDFTVSSGTDNTLTEAMLVCPESPIPNDAVNFINLHYGAHPRLMPNTGTWDGAAGANLRLRRVASVPNASTMALVFDAAQIPAFEHRALPTSEQLDGWRIYWDHYFLTSGSPNLNASIDGGNNLDDNGNQQNIRWRHNNNRGANVLHVDGHVGQYGYRSQNDTSQCPGQPIIQSTRSQRSESPIDLRQET